MKKGGRAIKKSKSQTLHINTHKGYYVVLFDDIEYCKACSSYCEIYLVNKQKIVCSKTLKWVEKRLQGTGSFYRIHKSFLINKNFIYYLSLKPKPEVILKDDTHVKLSFRKLSWLKEKMKEDN
jgi:two-component system LytT family response regulator